MHEQLARLVSGVRTRSYEAAQQSTIGYDRRKLRAEFPGQPSYDAKLPWIHGEPLSYFIEQQVAEAQDPFIVFDAGCGPDAVAIRQGKELFGNSVFWVGMDATIPQSRLNQGEVYVAADEQLVEQKLAVYAGNAPITLISGDMQSAPELLHGLQADVVVANKALQYTGDPWGFVAQTPLLMNDQAVFVANELPIDTVIPELKEMQQLDRFLRYCGDVLHLNFTHDAQEIAVFHRSAFVWDYARGMQIPLRYSGDTTKLYFVWTDDPNAIRKGINPVVEITALTYTVAWDAIERKGY